MWNETIAVERTRMIARGSLNLYPEYLEKRAAPMGQLDVP
jgi:hypothetical protein